MIMNQTTANAACRKSSRIKASPRARCAMKRWGVDPVTVEPTGPEGRIVEADVIRARRQATAPPVLANQASSMRLAVARKVSESFATVPHFYLRSEVDVTLLINVREQIVEEVERLCGQRVTLTDMLVRAMALALRDCPFANCIWQNNQIVLMPGNDVGLVVGVGDGLMVPVICGADKLKLSELVIRRAELVAGVRDGRLPGEVLQGGATALSNLGRHQVDEFAAIISLPHSSMLAVGRAAWRPAAWEGKLCLRQTLHLTLSVDHRVLDGGPAAEFLGRIVDYLQRPFILIQHPSF